ncbi:MAG: ABC transporter permease [Ilumatobacteraceae bacterium]
MNRLRIVAPIVGIVVFVAAWELFVQLRDVRPFVLTAPSDIIDYLRQAPGDFVEASWVTARQAFTGLAISLVVALVIAAPLAASSFLERAAQPILVLVQVAPFVAYVPSVVVWLGPGDPPARFMTALVCAPAFVFAAVAGMRSADPASRELFASVDASRWQVLWRLRLPSALPSLFTTARYNTGLALVVAYLVEGGNLADEGLGAIGRRAANNSVGEAVWATVFCMVILGTIALIVIAALERWILHWHASQRGSAERIEKRQSTRSVP